VPDTGYFSRGTWNFVCDTCGLIYKASKARLSTTQYGGPPTLRVCPTCWDVRNPQEFVRGVADPRAIPWSRPLPDFSVTNPDGGVPAFPRVMDASPMDSLTMG
jgi:rubredoxin